ncbi:hypothetical protein A5819_003606 [Enterococcus sp. 7E2_DIV0204]|uniref:hypothetical protein n=1 Tax=unclassified Enterococcus TaxID=2608891 RepID=UPI000A3556F4|nr:MULTISPECIES: hypothetical protein [unclassified Enterococcus]OTN84056.1 hypothetical protein A5819_003606 [Enterococcus sp. 7E2_DIV0204]OTP47256.1 hypothetical protein A5884_003631 [Enterococcus sp. 7D2_DIV0200]
MKKLEVENLHGRLCSSVSIEHFDPFYQKASYDFLVAIIDYIETQHEEIITQDNVFSKLVNFCTESNKREESGYEIYKEKLSNNQSRSSLALSYLSEKALSDAYSFLVSLIIATKANSEENS